MPRGDQSAYTDKQQRPTEHVSPDVVRRRFSSVVSTAMVRSWIGVLWRKGSRRGP
jgi:hypothetical protein